MNADAEMDIFRFLMAKLLLGSLVTKMTRKDLQEAIGELPKTLNDTYDDALSRINKQNDDEKELAERILSWISYAFRPLNIMELRHALAVIPGRTTLMKPTCQMRKICLLFARGSSILKKVAICASSSLYRAGLSRKHSGPEFR